MMLFGIDGCSAGWLVASADSARLQPSFEVHHAIGPVLLANASADAMTAIDIPIGLMEDDRRLCDSLARAFCAPRHSSVFSAPCRRALAATTFELGCRLNIEARGKAITRQLFGILPKIREVDATITPTLQNFVREAHPEVVFAAIGGTGRGVAYSKKAPEGEAERLRLLALFFGPIDPGVVRQRLGTAGVQRDDIVDALACLATAYRVSHSAHTTLPDGTVPRDSRGLRMEIVA